MLPLYKRTMRFVSDPYLRMKKKAVFSVFAGLLVVYLLIAALSSNSDQTIVIHDRPGFQAPPRNNKVVLPAQPNADDENEQHPGVLRRDDDEEEHIDAAAPEPAVAHDAAPPVDHGAGAGPVDLGAPVKHETATNPPRAPFVVRLFLPLLAGFCFGFLGSVPIAGPTSAMVLKLGIQGKYQAALTIAFGGAISEATYAGVAFWGFGSFLAGAKFLLPVSKVLGAIMFTIVGIVFLRHQAKPQLDVDADIGHRKDMRVRPRDEVIKNVLMGVTMSGINPALLATYTGAIASVYGTGMLEFTLFLAFVFAIGVWCGVSTWFFLLLSLLKKYKRQLKTQTIGYIMRGMGCFLLTLGAFCAKSSFDYFFWGPPETKL